jgi:hypothetical protein
VFGLRCEVITGHSIWPLYFDGRATKYLERKATVQTVRQRLGAMAIFDRQTPSVPDADILRLLMVFDWKPSSV